MPKTFKTGQEQTVFVPAYSHVYYRTGQEYLLAITLSVRNNSPTDSMLLTDEDTSGGSGANFLVKWKARKGVSELVIETVMIGTTSE